jgi:multicomponent Na+:H+ antiporter subunit E
VWRSNLRVAYDVLSPHPRIAPAIVELPLTASGDGEITALANLISLTPGTLSLKVSDDRRALFVHVMYLDDEPTAIAELKDLERRILEVLR